MSYNMRNTGESSIPFRSSKGNTDTHGLTTIEIFEAEVNNIL